MGSEPILGTNELTMPEGLLLEDSVFSNLPIWTGSSISPNFAISTRSERTEGGQLRFLFSISQKRASPQERHPFVEDFWNQTPPIPRFGLPT